MIQKFFIHLSLIILSLSIGFFMGRKVDIPTTTQQDSVINKIIERPFEKYAIDNLSKANIKKSELKIGEVLADEKLYISYQYTQQINANLDGKTMQTVSGMINIPKVTPEPAGGFPVVVMFRGYVDPTIYSTGVGTKRGAEFFAQNGFITVSPDFLGYAKSDSNAGNILESRFQTYTTALSTLFSIDSIPQWDKRNVFLWGHSNGGAIALTVLEITGTTFPTVLWSPVSKPFPYSVLYYTDDSADLGKFLRGEIAKFEQIYDADLYSIHKYWDRIKAPIQIHQGTGDDAVPLVWSNRLVSNLKKDKEDIEVEYFTYSGGDHNLQPGWNMAISRSLDFYKKYITN